MACLTAEQILAADDRDYVIVDVPEWGGQVRLGSMSARQRIEHSAFSEANREKQPDLVMANMLAMCIYKDDGMPAFSPAQVVSLSGKKPAVILDLFRRAVDLNALRAEDVEKKEQTSSPIMSDDSPSGSPTS